VGFNLRPQFLDPPAEVLQRSNHLLDPLRPQTQFFD